jgi:hypothetical protein
MTSGKITKINLNSSNLAGGELPPLPFNHVPRTTSDVPCTLRLIFSLFSSFDYYFLHAGPIPEIIGQLQSLTDLQLQDNELSGAFTNISGGVWDVASDVLF